MKNIFSLCSILFSLSVFGQKLYDNNIGFQSILSSKVEYFNVNISHFETEAGYEPVHELEEEYFPELVNRFNKINFYVNHISPEFLDSTQKLMPLIIQLNNDIHSKKFNRDSLLVHTKALKTKTQELSQLYKKKPFTYLESIHIIKAHLTNQFLNNSTEEFNIIQEFIETIPNKNTIIEAINNYKKTPTIKNFRLIIQELDQAIELLK